MTCFPYSRCNL